MSIYDKSTSQLMAEYLHQNYTPGEKIEKESIVKWFLDNYPKIKRNTVWCHIVKFTTNNPTRIHYKATKNNDYLFQLPNKSLRLFDPNIDPPPIYTIEETGDDTAPELPDQTGATQFAYESHLRDYLKDNLHIIEPGLKLHTDEEDESIIGVEFDCGGKRMDLLAVDGNDNYVVIELKVSKGYERTIGQILRYRAWVRKEMASGKDVRGIIIAKKISPDLKLAAEEIENIQLFEYDLSLQIRKV